MLGSNDRQVWEQQTKIKQLMLDPPSYDHALLYKRMYDAMLSVMKGQAKLPIEFEVPPSLVEEVESALGHALPEVG